MYNEQELSTISIMEFAYKNSNKFIFIINDFIEENCKYVQLIIWLISQVWHTHKIHYTELF